jgi:hypothetical protein
MRRRERHGERTKKKARHPARLVVAMRPSYFFA